MPLFTLQIVPQGPIVRAFIGVSFARREVLAAESKAAPNPVPIFALIDTGASNTRVDPSILKQLALSPTGQVSVNTPSTGSATVVTDQYDVIIFIPGAIETHLPLVRQNVGVILSGLVQQGIHALIGRDVLAECLLTYNGPNGTFTLSY